MLEVGIRELKQRASEVLRRVREDKESVTITFRGRAVARLVPFEDEQSLRAEGKAVLADMSELAREIGAVWPAGVTAADAVREQRRDL